MEKNKMKKILLILLCLPMIFISCNDIKQINNQMNQFKTVEKRIVIK